MPTPKVEWPIDPLKELEQRVAKLEEQVEKLTRKANPTVYRRCKAFLSRTAGNFPEAIRLARSMGDDEAANRLEDERDRID